MGISRQAYYQSRQRNAERAQRAEVVVKLVNGHRLRQPRLGTRKLHHLLREPLQQAGVRLGRDAMFDVLRNARMLVPTRRAYHKTTDSHHQNALAERVNGILKNEFLLSRPADLAQARRMVAESIEIYNHERPHLSLKMQTPDAVHRASMAGQAGSSLTVLSVNLIQDGSLFPEHPGAPGASHTNYHCRP